MLDLESLLEDGEQKEKAAAKAPVGESTDEFDLDFAETAKPMESSDLEIEIEPVDEATDAHAPLRAARGRGRGGCGRRGRRRGRRGGRGRQEQAGCIRQGGRRRALSAYLNMTGATSVLEAEAEPETPVAPKVRPRPAARPSGLRKVLIGSFALHACSRCWRWASPAALGFTSRS